MRGWGVEPQGVPSRKRGGLPSPQPPLQGFDRTGVSSMDTEGQNLTTPPFNSPLPGQQQLTVQNVSGNNVTISGLSPTQIQLQMEQALAGELQPGEKRRRMACTCPNCKDGDKR